MCGLGLILLPYTLLTLAEANSTHTHAATDSDSNSHIWPMRIPERKHNWLRLFLPKTKTSSHKLNPVFGRNSKKTIQSHLLHVPFDSDADRKEQPTKTLSKGNIEIDRAPGEMEFCSMFHIPSFLPTHGQVSSRPWLPSHARPSLPLGPGFVPTHPLAPTCPIQLKAFMPMLPPWLPGPCAPPCAASTLCSPCTACILLWLGFLTSEDKFVSLVANHCQRKT